MQFDHIGIIVADLQTGKDNIASLFPIVKYSEVFCDEGIGVNIIFATDNSGIRYELISPLDDNSPIAQALERKANLLNHVAYTTEKFDEEIVRLGQNAFMLGVPQPAVAFGGARVVFFMTRLDFIIELVERIQD